MQERGIESKVVFMVAHLFAAGVENKMLIMWFLLVECRDYCVVELSN